MNTDNSTAGTSSWLATITFAFVSAYMHMTLNLSLFSMNSLLYFGLGLVGCKLLVDVPGLWLQAWLVRKGEESGKENANDQAAAYGTFIKAAQVILAFVIAKTFHPMLF